jgi:hypothetical protein
MIDVVALGEGHAGVAAVNAGTRGVDQMLNRVLAAAFEDVHEADQIAIDVGVGVEQRVAHAGLGSQVNHALETFAGKQRGHRPPVGDVPLDEAKIALSRQAGQAGVLEANVVVVVEVVDADDRVTATQEAQRGVHADETGRAVYEASSTEGTSTLSRR